MPWGSIIGGAIGAVGSLIGGHKNNNAAAEAAAREYQNQKEFAQNGVRWKVADAKAAGIHPLAALGAQTFAYNPVAVQTGDGGVGDALSQMGQGVSRAFEAKRLREEREADDARREMEDVFNMAVRNKQLEQMDLQNDIMRQQLKASQIAIEKSALPPAMPSNDARLPAGQNVNKPVNQYQWFRDAEGQLELMPSEQYAQIYEDKPLGADMLPLIEAGLRSLWSKFTGEPVDGRVWDWSVRNWVPYRKGVSKGSTRKVAPQKYYYPRSYR